MILQRRNLLFAISFCLLLVGGLFLKAVFQKESGYGTTGGFDIGGAFKMTATDGRQVNEGSWPGKLLLITFGYRFCPDVCPTNLQAMAATLDLLGADAERVQPLFITIDPERDSREAMAAYVALFHPRMIGLTGTKEEVATVAKTFRVYYRKVENADPINYSVDHSAFTFLTDDHGIVHKLFSHNTPPQQMATGIKDYLQR
ncbi:MAG: SCO family protein [Rhodospirillaceae bacterium]